MNEKIFTLDGAATREAIRIKFYSVNKYAIANKLNYTTLYRILSGSLRYVAAPGSVYQGILRRLHNDGVLVEASTEPVQEAA